MFWKFDLNATSHVDKLLEKEDVTLQELMDEDDLLQECKAQNRKLVDFLCRPSCMEELVRLITQEPPLDMDEKVRFKYPNTACELLTSDVPQINDKLGGDEALLSVLYDFLDHEPPLNPLLASFFSKTIGNLIARKTEQVIAFLRRKEHFIDLVLKHINTSAMMDILLRLISCVEPSQLRHEVLNWLNDAKVIQRLVGLIHPSQDEDRQSNASQTLCDVIRLSRDQGSQLQEPPEADPLLAVLESQECVEQLLKNMFDGERTESCIVSGTQALLTLLEPRRGGVEGGLVDAFSQGGERPYSISGSVLSGIEPRLSDFHDLLLHPPKAAPILTTIGVLEEPLGNARLHGARLVAALLHTNTPSINQELCRLNTMDLLLDLFFKYTWNNFLHFQVELCIAAILALASSSPSPSSTPPSDAERKGVAEGDQPTGEAPKNGRPENIMLTHLFQRCCLVQRILDAWETNDRMQAEGGMRRGNMGHLTRIANAVVQNVDKGPMQAQISEFIKGLPEDCRGRWESFVEETLTEANRRNTVDLVSTHHLHSSSEDEDAEAAFSNELSLQQAFSEYQIQQMTANFVDQFGFNDEEFAEPDDNINAPFDRIAEINFNIDADDDSPNAPLFEACCSERIQQFDDNEEEEEEDIWEEKERSYAARVKSRTRFGPSRSSEGSSRSDLENGGPGGSGGGSSGGSSPESGEDEPQRPAPPPPGRSSDPPQEQEGEGEKKGADPTPEGSGWTAVFEPVSSMPPASCVAMDVGSSVWDAAALDAKAPEERGWAKFTDFQPFCCSEAGPRCSSPVEAEGGSSDAEGGPAPPQEKAQPGAAPSSPCAWNVCVARKAPLVASDSSSSGGSESEEEAEDRARGPLPTETLPTEILPTGPEAAKAPTEQPKSNEEAPQASSSSNNSALVSEDKVANAVESTLAADTGGSAAHSQRSPPSSAAAAPTTSEAKKGRKEELLTGGGGETVLNGPA
ncbi:serine/threonine-protein phosphatase 6 regulatory subunit 2 isoform X1 [Anolis sagrei]|uniref:serine/threonine-protein phosphatase 6 regulatory subunit 2 isoform X1 n=1 Tax=Anolis sagrei TaxID=38937 RepID=UPI003522F7DF